MDGVVAIVLAAGSGERMGSQTPKAFVELGGRPLLAWSAEALAPLVSLIVAAVPDGYEAQAAELLVPFGPFLIVEGGLSRHASVRQALTAVPPDAETIVCHDAARPFVAAAVVAAVLEALARAPDAAAAVPTIPIVDTVKRIDGDAVLRTEPRDALRLAQTPQAIRAPALRDAHERAAAEDRVFTDDAACLEWAGYRVVVSDGDPENLKVTTAHDLALAELMAVERVRG